MSSRKEHHHDQSQSTAPPMSQTTSMMANAFGSAAAGIVGRCVTHPLDTAKARLQAVSSGQYNYKGPFDVLYKTATAEGIAGLYRGFGTVIVGGTPGTILYLCSYDVFKKRLSPFLGTTTTVSGSNSNSDSALPKEETFLVHFCSGLLAETVACIVYVPVDVIKERLQVQHNNRINPKMDSTINYKNGWDALLQISKTEGIRGIYKGYAATLASFGPFSALYFVFYERAKSWCQIYLQNRGDTSIALPVGHQTLPFGWIVLSSATAGALASWLTSPLDMAKLRLQVQRGQQHQQQQPQSLQPNGPASSTSVQYRGVIDCLASTFRKEGWIGLFRGAGARVLHFAPATTVTMTCYETCRTWFVQKLHDDE